MLFSSKLPTIRIADLAADYDQATEPFHRAGCNVLLRADYQSRATVCEACEYSTSVGIWRCEHLRRGCSKLNPWLASEECPLKKWDSIS